jgi:ABC-type multidrug transport system fused ATPase/permease subunit
MVLAQSLSNLLDLIGVGLFGLLGALAVTGVSSRQPGTRTLALLEFLKLQNFSLQAQSMTIAGMATFVMVFKTFIAIYFNRKILYFLSKKSATITTDLVSKYFSQPLDKIQLHSSPSFLQSTTSGVLNLTIGVLGAFAMLIGDFSLLVIMFLGLIYVDTTIAISTLLVFVLVGLALYKLMHHRARVLGSNQTVLSVKSDEKILELYGAFRELKVKDRLFYYISEITTLRTTLSKNIAESAFIPSVSKYVIEMTIIVGALVISAVQFILQDSVHAIGALAVFMAAGTRMGPAVLRIQQNAVSIRTNLGACKPTIDLYRELESVSLLDEANEIDLVHSGFVPSVALKSVSFRYETKSEETIDLLDIDVSPGEFVAIVGPSGSGKTTVADLILGILNPQLGEVLISGESCLSAMKKWPGAIAYVPQDILLIQGSIKENILLGMESNAISDAQIEEIIRIAELIDLIQSLPHGMHTQIGERGAKLSGGQRQRVGLARALVTNPKLVLLDEATSALDGMTEEVITQSLGKLKGIVTVIVIAHRLSTVRDADRVLYLEEGKIIAQGKFNEVRSIVPNFDKQARLMGL